MPVIFETYFELGKPETKSPFIKKSSLNWGKNLDLKGAFLAAFFLAAAFVLSFYPNFNPIAHVLLVGVYFFAGIPSLIESIEDLINFEVNIDVLMILAAFSSVFIGSGFEGGLLLVLFSISGAMEEAVRTKAKSALSSLHKLSPTTAHVIEENKLIERSLKEIAIGTMILVKSGQVVPLDGIVTEGTSSVNLVHLTGENFPVTKTQGDEVPAGARNLEGALTVKVSRTSADSTLSKIIELVTQAEKARPRLQRWFDSLSRTYAISIILLSFSFAVSLPWILRIPFLGNEGSLYRALAFLIAASPCALIIAIPIAYLSAVGACAKKGILLKGGISLDAYASTKKIAFDKTGTLTTGELTLVAIEPLENRFSEELAFTLAWEMERGAVHPIAKAILQAGEKRTLNRMPLTDFTSIAGYGLEAKTEIDGKLREVYIGRPEYILKKLHPQQQENVEKAIIESRKKGQLLALLAIDSSPFLLLFTDTPRPKIKETLRELKSRFGVQSVMLTGDHQESARRIAEELDIDEWQADLKPEDKLEIISTMSQKLPLAMVGDGVNDAPALARATVGICMGKIGATAAMDASDIVLLNDNIELLSWLYAKAKKNEKIVLQNLVIASAAILFASIPALAGIVPLWLAVILHEGGTVLVGLNALRVLRD